MEEGLGCKGVRLGSKRGGFVAADSFSHPLKVVKCSAKSGAVKKFRETLGSSGRNCARSMLQEVRRTQGQAPQTKGGPGRHQHVSHGKSREETPRLLPLRPPFSFSLFYLHIRNPKVTTVSDGSGTSKGDKRMT